MQDYQLENSHLVLEIQVPIKEKEEAYQVQSSRTGPKINNKKKNI